MEVAIVVKGTSCRFLLINHYLLGIVHPIVIHFPMRPQIREDVHRQFMNDQPDDPLLSSHLPGTMCLQSERELQPPHVRLPLYSPETGCLVAGLTAQSLSAIAMSCKIIFSALQLSLYCVLSLCPYDNIHLSIYLIIGLGDLY